MNTEPQNHHISCGCGHAFSTTTADGLCLLYLEHVKTCPWHLEWLPKPVKEIEPITLEAVQLSLNPAFRSFPAHIDIKTTDTLSPMSIPEAEQLIVWLGEVLERHRE